MDSDRPTSSHVDGYSLSNAFDDRFDTMEAHRSNSRRGRAPTRAPAPPGLDISGMNDIVRSQQQNTPRQLREGQYMPRAYSPSPSPYSPSPSYARPSSPALDRGQVPAGMRLISRDASGMFNLESVEGSPAPRPATPTLSPRPATPVTPSIAGSRNGHARDASNASSSLNSVLSKFTTGHNKKPSTATTSSSVSTKPLKRPDSGSGPKSSVAGGASSPRPSSRRGSFKELIRRGSQELSHAAEILLMTEPQRETYVEIQKEKARADFAKEHPAVAKVREMKARRAAEEAKQEAKWKADRDARNAAHDAKMAEYEAQLARYEHLIPNDKENEDDADATPRPILSAGEKYAFLISKAIDPLKPKLRKFSNDSDMDFADIGIPEMEPYCDRCGRSAAFLKGELCDSCHRAAIAGSIEKIDDFFEQESLLGSSEDESSDYRTSRSSSSTGYRPVNEEEYMKTAIDRRIRRVRRTIYDDPGNPFHDFDDELTVPMMLYQRSTDNSPAPSEPSVYGTQPRIELSDSPASMMIALEAEVHEANSPDVGLERFGGLDLDRDTPLPAPRPQRAGTPNLVRAQSVRDAASNAEISRPESYVPARRFWRNSLPGGKPSDDDPRNTVFYGFYDGVLDDYRASQ